MEKIEKNKTNWRGWFSLNCTSAGTVQTSTVSSLLFFTWHVNMSHSKFVFKQQFCQTACVAEVLCWRWLSVQEGKQEQSTRMEEVCAHCVMFSCSAKCWKSKVKPVFIEVFFPLRHMRNNTFVSKNTLSSCGNSFYSRSVLKFNF